MIEKVAGYANAIGFEVLNINFSPLKGPEGNIEYLLHLRKCEGDPPAIGVDLVTVVDKAFKTLAK